MILCCFHFASVEIGRRYVGRLSMIGASPKAEKDVEKAAKDMEKAAEKEKRVSVADEDEEEEKPKVPSDFFK